MPNWSPEQGGYQAAPRRDHADHCTTKADFDFDIVKEKTLSSCENIT